MSVTQVDTVVVGGGAMGSAAAWQLARRGVDTVLLERFTPGHTKGASHGTSRIAETLANLEIPHQWLSGGEASERWPGITFAGRALYYPNSGRLHADNAVSALQRTAAALGADVRHESQVISIDVTDDNSVTVLTPEQTYVARRVVVAAGGWAAKLLTGIAPLPPITVTQEQPAHFAPRDPAAEWPSFVILHDPAGPDAPESAGVYGLSAGAEGVKVGFHGTGPVVDPDHRDHTAEPRQLAALQDYVRRWVPGVDADVLTPISCTYATTADSNFVIDRSGPVVVAAGFSGHGFKFVPAIGRLLADLAADKNAPALFSFRSHSSKKVV